MSRRAQTMRLTLLAPNIVEAVLDGRQSTEMTLAMVIRTFPVNWEKQRVEFG
jgi:hypothetical protein